MRPDQLMRSEYEWMRFDRLRLPHRCARTNQSDFGPAGATTIDSSPCPFCLTRGWLPFCRLLLWLPHTGAIGFPSAIRCNLLVKNNVNNIWNGSITGHHLPVNSATIGHYCNRTRLPQLIGKPQLINYSTRKTVIVYPNPFLCTFGCFYTMIVGCRCIPTWDHIAALFFDESFPAE